MANYPNEALTHVCRILLDEWELSQEHIENIAADLPGECEGIRQNRAEDAYMDHQQSLMESGGPDNSSYRRDMIAAGRGHLLGGR